MPRTMPAAVALAAVLLSACARPPDLFPRVEAAFLLDLRPYTESGFLFTPLEYAGSYDAIGPIEVVLYPEYRRVKVPESTDRYEWIHTPLQHNEVLDLARDTALRLGADSITIFRVTQVSDWPAVGLYRSGLRLEGFAIKRK